jgi:hypothetical protein
MLDLQSLFEAANLRRTELGLSWEQLAEQLDAPVEELRCIGSGDPRMTVVLRTIEWTGLDIDAFITDEQPQTKESAEKAHRVAAFLRADRDLKPESAEAIEAVLKAAYDRFATPA